MEIRIANVRKEFERYPALYDVSLDIRSGELIALLGPSGSGKTTLLRLIAGLEHPNAGTIYFGNEDASHKSVQERNVGFVFQHYAAFKHMTVRDNIAFGLKVRKRPKAEIRERVDELLKLVQLEAFGHRYPAHLSGGQRQRMALARALAPEPEVLLLDEPFGALDARVRAELRDWLRRLHEEVHVTTIFVTHDQEEAMEVADRIVVMNQGRIEQDGPPDEVYDHPASPFVLQFLGDVNLFHGRVDRAGAAGDEVSYVRPHELQILDIRVTRMLRLVHARYVESSLTMRQVAHTVNLCPSHVARMLKQQTGFGFLTHLHRCRSRSRLFWDRTSWCRSSTRPRARSSPPPSSDPCAPPRAGGRTGRRRL
jgi:sulfate transport system ATP-binding protein